MAKIVIGSHVDEWEYYSDFAEVLQEAPFGYEVRVVGSAGELIEAATQADLIIAFSYMPRGTFEKANSVFTAGFEAIKEVRAQGVGTPVIFMGTVWPAPSVENATILEVPARLGDFLEAVQKMLG